MSGSFRIYDAVPAAARIAYLAAKILVNEMTPIAYYKGQDIRSWNIVDQNWNFLNKLKNNFKTIVAFRSPLMKDCLMMTSILKLSV
ncbi:MAG: hypothetical protein ACOXZV_02250 [Bacteroidales bacterium]|jgi:hypothetical protein